MKALLNFELSRFYTKIWFYPALLCVLAFGFVIGNGLSLSLGANIFKNAPYSIALMGGFLSLFCIFFATILVTQIVFKETDYNFHLIFNALPIRKANYLWSKFLSIFGIGFLCFVLLMTGFAIGQQIPSDRSRYTDFNLVFYLQPIFIFGFINTIFCSSLLAGVAWLSKNKMMVYVSGLLLYIFYMVMLIFSGSPLMTKGMPQSAQTILLSAIFDPFGVSAFFLQTSHWTVEQRNTEVILPVGIFLGNRVGVIVVSLLFIFFILKRYSFESVEKKVFLHFIINGLRDTRKSSFERTTSVNFSKNFVPTINPSTHWSKHWFSLISITKIDLKYLVKSIPFVIICIGFLFYLSMEMYGDIEKGVRLPQKYATSGLLASTIIDEFNVLCLLAIIFYTNDIFWRSKSNNFHLIESSTPISKAMILSSKWLTISVLIVFFTCLMIALGIVFQVAYDFLYFDWWAYLGVFIFVSFRIIVAAGFMLLVQQITPNKMLALILSASLLGFMATSFGNRVLNHPTLEFLMPFAGKYTDMNGFGVYLQYFELRYAFGLAVVLFLLIIILKIRSLQIKSRSFITMILLFFTAILLGFKLSEGYKPKNEEVELASNSDYEKQFRKFQNRPQPVVTNIKTQIDLFPEKRAYQIEGIYILQNKSAQIIDSILVNFADDFQIKEAEFEGITLKKQYNLIALKKPLLPKEKATMRFTITYGWATVNGHQSLNAIVENGSFMRISRYFPQIGYLTDNEIEGKEDREKFNLGEQTALRKVDAPKSLTDNFINLDMKISTDKNQTAIGVGELTKQWKQGERNYFHYKTTTPIPFRFAVSSANYAIKKEVYQGKSIEIFYHPTHTQNVSNLLENIKVSLDYCQTNFGKYPFRSIRFAEVSGFTKGFAATAYSASIFMTENMVFDANINADKKQDVINELAGHELSHLWWGNNQISPDEREGAAMLTETLAMYTELMIAKKMHGQKRVLENVHLYQRMYFDERGFNEEQPLFKVLTENAHLSYYKGLVAMYQLSELIGEAKVNEALKSFLKNHAHPNPKPITTDLISAFYGVSDTKYHAKIEELFKQIVTYDLKIKTAIFDKKQFKIEVEGMKITQNEKGKLLKIGMNESIEIAIHFEKSSPKIMKVACINGKVSSQFPLTEKPIKVVIDPFYRFLNENIDEAERNLN
jgi:ABC-2 type transport system permease protein